MPKSDPDDTNKYQCVWKTHDNSRATVKELATGGGILCYGCRRERWSFTAMTSSPTKAVHACVRTWLGRISMETQPTRASVPSVQVCVVRGNLEKVNGNEWPWKALPKQAGGNILKHV